MPTPNKKNMEGIRRYHRTTKLDAHLHQDAINEELMEGMIEYGHVKLCKAIVRNGLENEGIGYMETEDGQFWTSIIRKAIEEDRE